MKFVKKIPYAILITLLLNTVACDKDSRTVQIEDLSRLYYATFPGEGKTSMITSSLYSSSSPNNIPIKTYSAHNNYEQGYSLTEGQSVYFKDINAKNNNGVICITGGLSSVVNPQTGETLAFPVSSPVLGNKDVEVPVYIKYISKNDRASVFTFEGTQDYPEYVLKISGNVGFKLQDLNLAIDYVLKNDNIESVNNTQWFSQTGQENNSNISEITPFIFKGNDITVPAGTSLTADDILNCILNSKAISLERFGFGSGADSLGSIADIFKLMCYNINYSQFGNGWGIITPRYCYEKVDFHTGASVTDYVVDLTVPYFSFMFRQMGKDSINLYTNLSSIAGLKMISYIGWSIQARESCEYYPFESNMYKTLIYSIIKAVGEKAISGVQIQTEITKMGQGENLTMWLSDSEMSKSILLALVNLYIADSTNLNKLKGVINASEYSQYTTPIIDTLLAMPQLLDKCPNFQFGLRFNNYFQSEKEESASIYKLVWEYKGMLMGSWVE
ncbi:MAG: hypothetical protein HDS71_00975 [Bacteroidales bacterium]|nr:hypothetical protein [Bacteroidales bacterium]MBD5222619.1 hypothetical protein [Bacteroidales bacterium]